VIEKEINSSRKKRKKKRKTRRGEKIEGRLKTAQKKKHNQEQLKRPRRQGKDMNDRKGRGTGGGKNEKKRIRDQKLHIENKAMVSLAKK
jgi:hypothetical protein